MTKKEAFDYLKGTKVVLRTEDEQLKLQEFLFSIGYEWINVGAKAMKLYDNDCMFFIGTDGYITHNGYDYDDEIIFCETHIYTELKLKDILEIEIDEEDVSRKDVLKGVRDTLKDKQIMVISKDNVMVIDL